MVSQTKPPPTVPKLGCQLLEVRMDCEIISREQIPPAAPRRGTYSRPQHSSPDAHTWPILRGAKSEATEASRAQTWRRLKRHLLSGSCKPSRPLTGLKLVCRCLISWTALKIKNKTKHSEKMPVCVMSEITVKIMLPSHSLHLTP